MPTTVKSGAAKGANKRSTKPSQSGSSSKLKKKSTSKVPATQHKPKPTSSQKKPKKPLHLRYTEKELNVPQLNGIRPTGVKKLPNRKKGKRFVDDSSMRTILAMVVAEKEGNIESKMIKARQLEEIREARKAEIEKRAESKKASLQERKENLKGSKRKGRRSDDAAQEKVAENEKIAKKPRKKVSFG